MTDFRKVHLPYCIKRLEDGSYVVLNRDKKPIGFTSKGHIDYGAFPVAVKFRRLTGKTAARLSWNASPDTDAIFLYNDGCIPTLGPAHMRRYLEKLSVLAKLKLDVPEAN